MLASSLQCELALCIYLAVAHVILLLNYIIQCNEHSCDFQVTQFIAAAQCSYN